MEDKKIKGIIFDCIGVFTENFKLVQFVKDYNKNSEKEDEAIKLMLGLWFKARVGEIDSNLFWTEQAKFHEVTVEEYKKSFTEYLGLRPKVITLAKGLAKNYKTAVLSNHIKDWFEDFLKANDLENTFDFLAPSYDLKVSKPDHKAYNLVLDKLGLKAEEVLFIDDMEKNILSAEELGLQTIQFESYEHLLNELKKKNIL